MRLKYGLVVIGLSGLLATQCVAEGAPTITETSLEKWCVQVLKQNGHRVDTSEEGWLLTYLTQSMSAEDGSWTLRVLFPNDERLPYRPVGVRLGSRERVVTNYEKLGSNLVIYDEGDNPYACSAAMGPDGVIRAVDPVQGT